MRVRRRRVTWIGVGDVVGPAGCIERDENENEDENGTIGSNDPTENESKEVEERNVNENEEDATDGTLPERVKEVSFEVFEVENGTGEESASVSFENDRVFIRGTIRGANGCYTARIADVSLSDDEHTIAVESYEDADEGQAHPGAGRDRVRGPRRVQRCRAGNSRRRTRRHPGDGQGAVSGAANPTDPASKPGNDTTAAVGRPSG